MRKIILQLAVSLDGFIEGPNGEYDWCLTDQDYGMSSFLKKVDTLFMGRKSYDLAKSMPVAAEDPFMVKMSKIKQYVFSNSLKEDEVQEPFHLVSGDTVSWTKQYKQEKGKDIWLWGGASLTTSFMDHWLVDELVLAVHPILLGDGKPLFHGLKHRVRLDLKSSRKYPSRLVMLRYAIVND